MHSLHVSPTLAWHIFLKVNKKHLEVGKSKDKSSLGRTALALKPFAAHFLTVLLLVRLRARRRGLGPEAGP